jgi:hypothetical protein
MVVCSCGESSLLHWPRGGKCWVEGDGWVYHADPDDESKTRLWHCGRDGHRQAGLIYINSVDEVVAGAAKANAKLAADLAAARERIAALEGERDRVAESLAIAVGRLLHDDKAGGWWVFEGADPPADGRCVSEFEGTWRRFASEVDARLHLLAALAPAGREGEVAS